MSGHSQLVWFHRVVFTSLPLSVLRRRRRRRRRKDVLPVPPLEGVQLSVVVVVMSERLLLVEPASVIKSHVKLITDNN